ncbi:UNVERIFIED_CONTAM: Retrovirus-related Pol polyprotein from transposon RE2 [Sesamum radiatum]|uniref:Retrovirus-related Pol polyprotein from transposon RE2 n=1 Tax=Sesamum radiatum TaxID=300843 RepID=A0AAW2JZP4_SESRA
MFVPWQSNPDYPFQTSTSKSSTLFELIHIDLWGPYKHASLSGCHFFLTIVDDYSRTTWTYLLKHKSQAVPLLETYLQMVQTQFDAKYFVLPDLTATPLPLMSLTDDPLMLSNPNPQLTDVPEQSHLPHSTSTDLHFSSSSSELNLSLPHDEATSLPSPEPSTFSQAQQHAEWREAMNHELTALEKNHTWELTTLPEGKRAIGSKWVYKVKLNPDGTVERYKARLVAKGYNQIEGLDINNAFLHGYLDEAVYMTPPEGYEAPLGMLMVFLALLVYVDDVLITDAKTCTTPLPSGLKFSANEGALLQEPDRYRRLIGKFLYLGFTRPDISFAGSSSMALFFPSHNSLQLSAFSDADWATCVDSRRFSSSSYHTVPFWCDNQAALHITANPVFHERTKHLDIDCHIVRDQYKAGFISPRYIAGHLQPADAFTKILPVAAFTQSSVKLGLVSLPHAPT